tara:strand:+ start:322 stop:531 length:210 start_codon:yes stop_codon:yes gene_type:complete
MDIIDILDKKVKDAIEQRTVLEGEISNLEEEVKKLNKYCLDLKNKNDAYKDEISVVLSELDKVVRDLDI